MSFPSYPRMKDSDVEWVGDIPAHWEATKLNRVARLESGHTPSRQHPEYWIEDDCVIPWFTLADVGTLRDGRRTVIEATSQRISEVGLENSAARRLPPETVLLSRTASVGFSAVTAIELAVSQDFAAWVCGPRLRPRFLLYCLRAMEPEFRRLMMGSTHQTIYMPDIEAFRVPVPDVDAQDDVIDVLDRETAKIDGLIEAQRRLIELLKEKRQAVISHAVTKGLDPSVPMKDSGVEWLGEIPAHWEVAPLKALTPPDRAIMYGIVLPGPNVDAGVPIVKGGDVKPGRLKIDRLCRTAAEIEAPFARARLRPNDIVYSIRGSIGDAELVPEELLDANITQDVARISPTPGTNHRWLLHVMTSSPVFVQLEQRSLGATIRGINIFDLKRARIPLPPPGEREEIASLLDRWLAELDALGAEALSAISLLQERRAALISAAVTGKIDVRGLVEAPDALEAAE